MLTRCKNDQQVKPVRLTSQVVLYTGWAKQLHIFHCNNLVYSHLIFVKGWFLAHPVSMCISGLGAECTLSVVVAMPHRIVADSTQTIALENHYTSQRQSFADKCYYRDADVCRCCTCSFYSSWSHRHSMHLAECPSYNSYTHLACSRLL